MLYVLGLRGVMVVAYSEVVVQVVVLVVVVAANGGGTGRGGGDVDDEDSAGDVGVLCCSGETCWQLRVVHGWDGGERDSTWQSTVLARWRAGDNGHCRGGSPTRAMACRCSTICHRPSFWQAASTVVLVLIQCPPARESRIIACPASRSGELVVPLLPGCPSSSIKLWCCNISTVRRDPVGPRL